MILLRFAIAFSAFIVVMLSLSARAEVLQGKEERATVTIDLASLDRIKGVGERRFRLTIVAADNTTYISDIRFNPEENVANLAREGILLTLEDNDWYYEESGKTITVTGHIGARGKVSPVVRIHASSEGTYPLEFVPKITASANVKVERSAEPSKKK
jgi:hypothetical protein